MDTLADAFISRLKERLDARSDDQLAAGIGVAKSTIASWRRRGDIPPAVAKELEKKHGISFDAVRRELVTEKLDGSVIGDMILLLIAMRLGQELPKNKIEDWAQWIGASREDVLSNVVARSGEWNPAKESLIDKIHGIYRLVISDPFYGKALMSELRSKIEAVAPERHKGYE